MKQVGVWFHKDGDQLAISEVPWWKTPYEAIVNMLVCPCCGISGWLSGKSKLAAISFFKVWNPLVIFGSKFDKELLQIPIDRGCEVTVALWGLDKHTMCWRDDCPYKGKEGD